jgi:hypothetical protein
VTEEPQDLPPRNWSSLFLFVLLAIGLMVGGMMILGIPGALVAGVTAPIVEVIRGYKPGLLTDGDRAWGVALLTTMIFPPGDSPKLLAQHSDLAAAQPLVEGAGDHRGHVGMVASGPAGRDVPDVRASPAGRRRASGGR